MRLIQYAAMMVVLLMLLACSKHHETQILGYVEGKYVYLSSSVSGKLVQLAVQNK